MVLIGNSGRGADHWNVTAVDMPLAATKIEYRPRTPENGVLHRVVRDHLEEFIFEVQSKFDDGIPFFIEDELRRFLGCGHLASGFARLKCSTCGQERLLPFS